MASAPEKLVELPMEKVQPDPDQVRRTFDEETIASLAASIASQGLLSPIRVRPQADVFVIINGERRYRAHQHLGRKTIPAIVVTREIAGSDVTLQMLIENSQREDLNPMEVARSYRKLLDLTGWTSAEAAVKLGVAPATFSRHLQLLMADPPIQDAVESWKLGYSKACELMNVENTDVRAKLLATALEGKLPRDSIASARRMTSQTGDHPTSAVTQTKVVVSAAESVTVGSASTSLDALQATVEKALRLIQKARRKGYSLSTFVRVCRDEARLDTQRVVRGQAGAP
jgi:ParB family chromosome partitioning protein